MTIFIIILIAIVLIAIATLTNNPDAKEKRNTSAFKLDEFRAHQRRNFNEPSSKVTENKKTKDIPLPKYSKSNRSTTEIEEYRKYTRARKLTKNFVVLDFETTGLNQFESKIIQIGAVKYENNSKIDYFTTYVNPQTQLSSKIIQITGITDEQLKDAPIIDEVLPDLIEFVGDYDLVAHNASFDMKFLLYNMNNLGIPYKRFRVIDTLSLARKHIKTKNHKLVTLKKYLKLDQYKSHDALDDCYVTGEVYKYCYEREVNPPKLTYKGTEYYKPFELYTIGEELYKNKQLDDAEKYLLASIDKGNDAPAVFVRLAIIYRKQKRYKDEINISKIGKLEVQKNQGNYHDNEFDYRIKRAKELMQKEVVHN